LRDLSLIEAEKELEKNYKKGIIDKKQIFNDRLIWVLIKKDKKS
jgi:hypothetical protein